MSSDSPDPKKAAILHYQRQGDFDGALRMLLDFGQDRPTAVATLRESDFVAARVTAILAAVLIVGSGLIWVFWRDAWWLLFSLIAIGVERTFRTVTLIRRGRALSK